jgi:NitT/TauT family transport system substrate-binding protein
MQGRRRYLQAGLWAAGFASGVLGPVRAFGAEVPPKLGSVTVAINRPDSFCQLPLHLASRLGFIAEEGLRVEWLVLPDLPSVVQAVKSGRAHVMSGPFASTFEAHMQGLRWSAFVLQSRTPQFAVGLTRAGERRLGAADQMPSLRLAIPRGSQGAYRVGAQFLQNRRLLRSKTTWIEVDSAEQALALFRSGSIEGVCFPDPLMTLMERDSDVRLVADARTVRGTHELFGGLWPTSSLCGPSDFIRQRSDQCRALSHAVVRSLKWLQTAGLLDISRTVDERYFRGDRGLYLDAFSRNRESWSPDGVFSDTAHLQMQQMLARWDKQWSQADESLAYTVTNQWSKEAKLRFRA